MDEKLENDRRIFFHAYEKDIIKKMHPAKTVIENLSRMPI